MKKRLIKLIQLHGLYKVTKPVYDSLMAINPNYIRHKQKMLKFYSQFISKGDLCFDVGANLGNRTEIFLKLGATTVAIEPQDVCMRRLQKKYGNNNKVILIQKALGKQEGEGELMISNIYILSSMAKEWIKSVQASGRFSGYRWNKTVIVPVTTLDKLIQQYGRPAFCKIDVEGFEYQVLKGLSQPIKTIAFEFIPEFIDSTIGCIKHLSGIGVVQFNYSPGESMRLALSRWIRPEKMCETLRSLPDKTIVWDIYARFIEEDEGKNMEKRRKDKIIKKSRRSLSVKRPPKK